MHKSQQASLISNFTTYVLHVIFKQESYKTGTPTKSSQKEDFTGFRHFSWQAIESFCSVSKETLGLSI